jgi:FkbM family methyltransferase
MMKIISMEKVKSILGEVLIGVGFDPWVRRSWGQEGEDIVLHRIFGKKSDGFYVDIGAHHPIRFSNTYYFYKMGWRGLNIDAMPGSMRLFKKRRPRDINIEMGVGRGNAYLDYYVFNEPALNGFSREISEDRENKENNYKIERIVKLQIKTLAEVLSENLNNSAIDFMSVDVEGLDYEVLQSNNWNIYRPKILLVELLNTSLHDLSCNEIVLYMHKQGYELYAKLKNTVFFKDSQCGIG